MSRKTWFLLGAGFGLLVPILLNVIQRFGPWHLRPIVYILFRPGLLALYAVLEQLRLGFFFGFMVLAVNAAVFGVAAYALRYGFMLLISALLTISFLSLPPSDARLERDFSAQQKSFERLIQIANHTPSLVRITSDQMEDSDGRKYRVDDPQSPLSAESWREWRELLQKTGMKEGLYRPQTGQMQFLTATLFRKVGPLGTLYGYAYCPTQSSTVTTRLLPCSDHQREYDIGVYRYKRFLPEWSIVEIYDTRSLLN